MCVKLYFNGKPGSYKPFGYNSILCWQVYIVGKVTTKSQHTNRVATKKKYKNSDVIQFKPILFLYDFHKLNLVELEIVYMNTN